MPPNDVTQEGNSGFSAQFVLLPSDCMKLLPQNAVLSPLTPTGRGSVLIWAAFLTSVCGVASLAIGWDVAVHSVLNALAHTHSGYAPPCQGLPVVSSRTSWIYNTLSDPTLLRP